MSTPTLIQQRITSGGLFDGTMPAGDAVTDASNCLYKYTAAAVGGLFLWTTREPIICTQFLIDIGASGNIVVSVVNLNPATIETAPAVIAGEAMTVASATAVTLLALSGTNFRVTLLPFQALRLVTTATAAAQIAQCTIYLDRSRA